MKKISIKSLFFLSLAVGVGACKKGAMNIDQEAGSANNVVEFASTGDNQSDLAKSTFPRYYTDLGTLARGKSDSFNINVSYSGKDVAPEDITVKLKVDTGVLGKYNRENSTKFEVPATSVFSYPNTVVIKKGTRQTTVKAIINNNNDFNYNKTYAIPLKIESTTLGLISGNFGGTLYSFGIRNIYDGVYSVKGAAWRNDPTSNLQGPVGPIERNFTSAGLTTVQWSGTVPWANGSGSNLPGGYEPTITLDPVTNKVTITSPGGTLSNNPGYDNRYDPATKTFYISFTWGAGVTARLHTDTIVFVKPR